MKFLLALCLIILTTPDALAEEAAPAPAVPVTPVTTLEEDIVKTMMFYCLPPIIKKVDPAALISAFGLPELVHEQAAQLDPQGGRVFKSPNHPDNIMIIAGGNGTCSVVARDFDATRFWQEVDKMFGPGSPFMSSGEKSVKGGIQKNFEANYEGITALIIIARNESQPGMLQGIMTYSRITDQATARPAKP